MKAKKIVLVADLPVAPEHEMKRGNLYDIVRIIQRGVIVKSATGDEVTVLKNEYKIVEATK
jgi:hypothetical protein